MIGIKKQTEWYTTRADRLELFQYKLICPTISESTFDMIKRLAYAKQNVIINVIKSITLRERKRMDDYAMGIKPKGEPFIISEPKEHPASKPSDPNSFYVGPGVVEPIKYDVFNNPIIK